MKIQLKLDPLRADFISPTKILNSWRIKVFVYFRIENTTHVEFTQPFEAIVDTGALISVIPVSIWKNIGHNICNEKTQISGLNEREECRIPSKLGWVRMALSDVKNHFSPDFPSIAYLCEKEEVPLILGLRQCLEYFDLQVNLSKEEANLQWNG